jgi:hypothetical protein
MRLDFTESPESQENSAVVIRIATKESLFIVDVFIGIYYLLRLQK